MNGKLGELEKKAVCYMTTESNAKTTVVAPTERYKDDAVGLKDVGQFLAFAASLSTGHPLGLLAATELIVKEVEASPHSSHEEISIGKLASCSQV